MNDDNESIEKEDEKDEGSSIEDVAETPKSKYKYEYNIEHKPYVNKLAETAKPSETPVEPYSPDYYTRFTQTPQHITPYQKFSFQPIQAPDSYGLKSNYVNKIQTVSPYNPTYEKNAKPVSFVTEQTENIPHSLKLTANNCKKVNKLVSTDDIKDGRFKRQAMDCFVCEDPKTGANYEQCSYSTEPESESYFVGKAEKYSKPVNPISYRYKREAKNDDSKGDDDKYVNPYDYVKSRSHKYYSKPEEFDADYYKPQAYEAVEEYRFGPEYFSDSNDKEAEQERSYSEKQAEELKKNPENCKKIKKSGMTCMICKNEKTGANYEQCSYTSAPAEKKYAYVRERKFDKDHNPVSDKVTETHDPKEIAEGTETEEKHIPKAGLDNSDKEKSNNKNLRRSRSRYTPPNKEDTSYEVPDHFEKNTENQKQTAKGLDSKLYGRVDSAESNEKETKKSENYDYPELEEYNFKLFPQYNKEESKNEEKRVKVPDIYKSFEAEENKKDVEEVLAEFAKKDRSNCKKAHKKGMTCYLCVDKKGLENEECMYVSESQPKSTHIAYHELKKVNKPKPAIGIDQDGSQLESKIQETEQPLISKRKRVFKKVTTTEASVPSTTKTRRTVDLARRGSVKIEATTTPPKTRIARRLRRVKNVAKDPDTKENEHVNGKIVKRKAEPKINTPEEFKVGDEEGAFSAETRPVYSKQFGATLPRYMVEKTEYEVDFDKFSTH